MTVRLAVRPASVHRRVLQTVVVLVALALATTLARADEVLPDATTPLASTHLREGNRHYQLREYEQAVAAYKAGVRAEPKASVTFWYNLGQTYRQWGRYEDAIWFYTQFLKTAPASLKLHREAAENFITQMRAELDRAASTATPTETGPTPIRATEPATPTRTEPTTVTVALQPTPPPSTVEREPWHRDTTGWILVGGGVAGLAVGAGFLINASNIRSDADSEPRESTRDALYDKATTRSWIGGLTAGVGLVALGVGVVKLTITGRAISSDAPVRVTLGPRWVSLQGSF